METSPQPHPGPVSGVPCWSTGELAGILGVSRQAVHRWCATGVVTSELEERLGQSPLFHIPVTELEGLKARLASRRGGGGRRQQSPAPVNIDIDIDGLRQRLMVWEEIDRCRREQDRLRVELEGLRLREMELRSRLEVVPVTEGWEFTAGDA